MSDALQAWHLEARKHLGLAEIPGKEHSPTILAMLKSLKAWWADDETPWCGVFVAHCMRVAGVALPRDWMRAKAWASWGQGLTGPVVGCVVVFERQGGGHVGFVVGRDQTNRLLVLGGNQGNKVTVAPFDLNRVVGYRWPAELALPALVQLPVFQSTAEASSNEA